MMTRETQDVQAILQKLASQRILLLDGAIGTMIQRHKLSEADFKGEVFSDLTQDLKGNNDDLSMSQPQIIKDIIKCKNNQEARQVGVEWSINQCKELMDSGVPVLHFYSMGKADNIAAIAKELF